MQLLDWVSVIGLLVILLVTANFTRRHTKSVADFLAANRCAGRYLLTIASGMGGLGAISLIAMFEGVYVGGLTNSWWTMGEGLIVSIVMVSGWILYRFRQTRALTLAQFLEVRYSRSFRIFSGLICWLSGIINFGIFPSVGARFFMGALHIAPDAVWCGVSVYAWFLIVLIGISFLFTLWGGQIAVMVTDFIQGVFCNAAMILIVIFSIAIIGLPAINKMLLEGISADNRQRLEQAIDVIIDGDDLSRFDFEQSPKAEILAEAAILATSKTSDRTEAVEKALEYYRNNDSMIHPFKISGKQDLNIWFYLMAFWLNFYGGRIWQGTQGYNSSARTPHEARMGNVLAMLRTLPMWVFSVGMPICALAFYNSESFITSGNDIRLYLQQLDNPNLQRQMATPLAMMAFLPAGLRGCFVALMLAAFISTHNTYMHSWGSIFIQDVVMPFRKKPFTLETHMRLLKLSIFFVCIFIFIFSMVFRQTEYIVMFWNITGAIFTGGAGAVVIGGLYWGRGTTGAAWAAMISGSVLATGSIIIRQIHAATPFENPIMYFIASQNGMVLAFWSGLAAMAVYAVFSLLSSKESFNMDKMLHRGDYEVLEDKHLVTAPVRGIRALIGISREFTRPDRIVYYFCIAWMLGWAGVFLFGSLYGSIVPTTDQQWLSYWQIQFSIFLITGIVVAVWFSLGGIRDVFLMFKRLNRIARDATDDGMVQSMDADD